MGAGGIIPGVIQGVIGEIQTVAGAGQARRAQRKLEKMIDSYQPNEGILSYYNKALQRYNMNPYTSAMYNQSMKSAGRGLATGITALNDRRSVLGGVNRLVSGYDDAALKAAAEAEGQQAQALGQLGSATAMKAAEDKYKFEAKANLLGMKAGGGNQIFNAGLQNAYGGLGSVSDYLLANSIYGDQGGGYGGRGNSGGTYSPNYQQARRYGLIK